jgi:hypothetical protein
MSVGISMNNTFFDQSLGLEFVIPYSRQLLRHEAHKVICKTVEATKAYLFESWLNKSRNKGWTGDARKRAEDLFSEHTRFKAPMFVDPQITEAVLSDVHLASMPEPQILNLLLSLT